MINKLLTLTEGKTSLGVKDFMNVEVISKGNKFLKEDLKKIDYTTVQVSQLPHTRHNTSRKYNARSNYN